MDGRYCNSSFSDAEFQNFYEPQSPEPEPLEDIRSLW